MGSLFFFCFVLFYYYICIHVHQRASGGQRINCRVKSILFYNLWDPGTELSSSSLEEMILLAESNFASLCALLPCFGNRVSCRPCPHNVARIDLEFLTLHNHWYTCTHTHHLPSARIIGIYHHAPAFYDSPCYTVFKLWLLWGFSYISQEFSFVKLDVSSPLFNTNWSIKILLRQAEAVA